MKTTAPHVRSKRSKAQADAYLAVVRTAEDMQRDFTELLKASDLSFAQYNVLRILRGAGADGLTCGGVSERLVQHDPDVTRLLDRLEKRSLIERHRDQKDRRVVRTAITESGLTLLAELDEPVDAVHEQQLGHLSDARLRDLMALLEEARRDPA